jgi:hypothetical protein
MWEKILAVFSKDIIGLVKEGFISLSRSIKRWWKARQARKRQKKQFKDIEKEYKRKHDDYKDDRSTRDSLP